jgi:hypothetical protein
MHPDLYEHDVSAHYRAKYTHPSVLWDTALQIEYVCRAHVQCVTERVCRCSRAYTAMF